MLFLIALRMVFPSADSPLAESIKGEPFLVPLAIPYVAGPSTLATLLLLMSREPQRWPEWLLALTCAWLVSAAILVLGGRIGDFLGTARPAGARAAHGPAAGGARGADVDRRSAGCAAHLARFTRQ